VSAIGLARIIQASGERQLSGQFNTGKSRTANADRSPTHCFETHQRNCWQTQRLRRMARTAWI